MGLQTITARVPLKGLSTGAAKVRFITTGYEGEACRDATAALSKMLGEVVSDENTNEMMDEPIRDQLREGF